MAYVEVRVTLEKDLVKKIDGRRFSLERYRQRGYLRRLTRSQFIQMCIEEWMIRDDEHTDALVDEIERQGGFAAYARSKSNED